MSEGAIRILADLLEARTGQHLPVSRQWRIGTALSGLFRELDISSLDQLIALITRSRGGRLAQRVVEALLNNETYFYRDRAMFDQLSQTILPELARRRADRRSLSIWSAGCSTGQEALSLAMLFGEQEARWAGWQIDISGSDVSESAIETARKACYSQFEIQRGLGAIQMLNWFDDSPQGWTAKDRLRGLVHFQVHSVLDVPPAPGKFDLVLCRNVLLYFEAATRARAFDRLASALAPDGYLMLGAGETVVGHTEHFVPERGFVSIYSHAARPADSGLKMRGAGTSRISRAG